MIVDVVDAQHWNLWIPRDGTTRSSPILERFGVRRDARKRVDRFEIRFEIEEDILNLVEIGE